MQNTLCPEIPKLSKKIETSGWICFLLSILLIVYSFVVQGANIIDHGTILQLIFPWWLSVLIIYSSVCTYLASTGFSERLTHIKIEVKSIMTELSGGKKKSHSSCRSANGNLKCYRANNEVKASGFCLVVSNEYLPKQYSGLQELSLEWDIPKYFSLIEQEQSDARASIGRLAAALGGASVAGILSFGRLVQFLSEC